MMKRVITPLTDDAVRELKAGDSVLITGILITGRDTAHRRMISALAAGQDLPVDLAGQILYYAGTAPAKPGDPVGSIGPTSSYRMDPYTPELLARGLKGMIGKGNRSREVIELLQKYQAVYFGALGGAAALMAQCVRRAEPVAYADLGPEAMYRLEVEDFPATVVNDCMGRDLYLEGMNRYQLTGKTD